MSEQAFIPCYIKLLSHDLGIWAFKIISLISNKAKHLGGVNTEYSQEKPFCLTRNKKKEKVLSQHLTRPELEPTVVRWLCDSETVLLTCCLQGRQNCNIDWSLLKIVCASYSLVYCMNRRVVHIKKLYATSSYNLKGCVNGPSCNLSQAVFVACNLKGWTLSFLLILRWMLTNLDLIVYHLRYYFINMLNGLNILWQN